MRGCNDEPNRVEELMCERVFPVSCLEVKRRAKLEPMFSGSADQGGKPNL